MHCYKLHKTLCNNAVPLAKNNTMNKYQNRLHNRMEQ